MTDFEGALRNSLNQAFNTSSILGCWFHFTQAVRRKMQSLGLANVIEDEEGAHYLIKKVMCLPLLPAESIPDGLTQIMEENESLALYPIFGYINPVLATPNRSGTTFIIQQTVQNQQRH